MRAVTVRSMRQHRFHWFMTAITGGIWSPVLLLAYLKGKQVIVDDQQR